jgi:transcriptional regulator GlxA family with amidase domain
MMSAVRPEAVSREPGGPAVRVGLFVIDRFPMAPLSMVIETIRLANWHADHPAFSYVLVSADGKDRISSCDFRAPVAHSVKDCPPLDVVLVCAGTNASQLNEPATFSWLRSQYHKGARVGGISSGAFTLARAGLLESRRCAVHWMTEPVMRERFPNVIVSGDIFCTDGRVITCAGGISTLDLMLHLIKQFCDRALARRVADDLIYPTIRDGHEPARMSLGRRTGESNSALLRAVALMEANVEEAFNISEISKLLDTSARHLERLFRRAFRLTPSQYYMKLRLREARVLLCQSDIPLIEVALRCGFRNTSHFARRYRAMYKIAPSEQRRALA